MPGKTGTQAPNSIAARGVARKRSSRWIMAPRCLVANQVRALQPIVDVTNLASGSPNAREDWSIAKALPAADTLSGAERRRQFQFVREPYVDRYHAPGVRLAGGIVHQRRAGRAGFLGRPGEDHV